MPTWDPRLAQARAPLPTRGVLFIRQSTVYHIALASVPASSETHRGLIPTLSGRPPPPGSAEHISQYLHIC
ncbi:hypothetical protein H671_7g18154 [Cricetulus griseus]|nr:hypothetical protein H671_7g18154 [Cricetulus griseus]